MPGKILIGTASWADPGFIADWYPKDLRASERLPYYAQHFSMVELNSSFYAVPEKTVVQKWCAQTPEDFVFDVKLHRLLSRHSTSLKHLPPGLRPLAQVKKDKVLLSPKLEQALAKRFLEEISPLSNAGKLGALLLQLTPGFAPRTHKLSELDDLLGWLAPYPVAVELRNRHWLSPEAMDQTADFFRQRQVTFVRIDAPAGDHFTTMPAVDLVTNPVLAYLRLHGRNLQGYISGRTVAERFDYLYSDAELEEIAGRALKLAEQTAKTHVVYNNNCSDYAVRSASAFQQLIAQSNAAAIRRRAPAQKTITPLPQKNLELDFSGSHPRRR